MTDRTSRTDRTQTSAGFVDRIDMQNRLFSELSRMFGEEVPLYDKSLLVNRVCNRAVCELLGHLHRGFEISDAQLDKTSGERHGAIRIGRPDEYRWIGRFFACFAMEPHNYYDMTSIGAKSQPIVATAFRSLIFPEHRVFTSLLMTDYFDDATRARIEERLAQRTVFSDRAKELIERAERDGGLSWDDANDLIREGTDRIFKWTGHAHDFELYTDLCEKGFKIAADIACFQSHHLNHLTPNTFCMDLYTAAMKHALGETDAPAFRRRATHALAKLAHDADRDFVKLQFKHLTPEEIAGFGAGELPAGLIDDLAARLADRLALPDLRLSELKHAGFKDYTEGPATGTPVLLRQDAYRALTEPVVFHEPDGTETNAKHTARFGEIEQRFYATTAKGRALYDQCLAAAEEIKAGDPALAKRDPEAYELRQADAFAPFPKTLGELLAEGLVYARFAPTPEGLAARGTITTTDIHELARQGHARFDGQRYEDFLPVSAAGIFASNLNQYGTASTAASKPEYTREMLEDILGKPIVDADTVYAGVHAKTLLDTYAALELTERLDAKERERLEKAAEACPAKAVTTDGERVAARI